VHFEVLTLFPELFTSALDASLLGRARAAGLVQVDFTNPRDFAPGRHRPVDDTPYGGGLGMVMKPDVLVAAIEAVEAARGSCRKILLSPQGEPLRQAGVRRLAAESRLMLICGRYEGIDERVRGHVDEELTIGDYILTGGELPALVVIDAVARLCPGMLGKEGSAEEESFSEGLLEYPQYTRPADLRGAGVPKVLVSGNHERIRKWRRRQSLLRTRDRRPDLWAALELSEADRRLLDDGSDD
jgi:tRNA (guanine37-N1)-methyltransferase